MLIYIFTFIRLINLLDWILLRASAIYNKCLSFLQHLIQSPIQQYGFGPKTKVQHYEFLDIRENQSQVSLPIVLPCVRSPILQPSYHGTCHNVCLALSNGFLFPVNPWNYSNKSITSSRGNQGSPHPIITTKPAS